MSGGAKVLLLAGGAGALYLYGKQQGWFEAAPAAQPTPAAGGPPTQPGQTPPPTKQAGTTTAPTQQQAAWGQAETNKFWAAFQQKLVAAGYSGSSQLSCDQWGVFFNEVAHDMGRPPQPDPLDGCTHADSRGAPVSLNNWQEWLASKGRGMGTVGWSGYIT